MAEKLIEKEDSSIRTISHRGIIQEYYDDSSFVRPRRINVLGFNKLNKRLPPNIEDFDDQIGDIHNKKIHLGLDMDFWEQSVPNLYLDQKWKNFVSNFFVSFLDSIRFEGSISNNSSNEDRLKISDQLYYPEALSKIINMIRAFAQLKPNWDSYGALSIQWTIISRAIELISKITLTAKRNNKTNIPIPFVSPLANGGIEFEWEGFFKELIFSISPENENSIDVLQVDKSGSKELEEEKIYSESEFINLVVNWFL